MIFIIFIVGFFIVYLASIIIKPFIAVFFGNKIKETLKKDNQYYREKYKESRKHIDNLDKGFLKSVAETLHGSDCSEEEYITTQRKKEEKEYNSTLELYSFGVSFVCILILIGFGFLKVNEDNPPEPAKSKNLIVEKKVRFQKDCEGLKADTLESDFLKLDSLREQADMKKRRAKILYKQGLILRSQYQQVKDNRSAIYTKWGQYANCVNAQEDYRRAIATVLKETSKEEINRVKSPKKDNSPVLIHSPSPTKRYTNLEIKETCQHCIKYYNCMIKRSEKILYTGKYPQGLNPCVVDKGYSECSQLTTFLENSKFISKKHKEQFSRSPWHAFPDYYKHCSKTKKVSCKTSTCWSNNPSGVYDVAVSQCNVKNQIESWKFLKDAYCGKLQKKFFKL